MQLMVIEAVRDSAGRLSERLGAEGFRVGEAVTAEQALRCGPQNSAAAILVDLGPNAAQGASFVNALRGSGAEQPLLVLSSMSEWRDKVACLDAGADDYLEKPVRSEEVAARLRAIVRRSSGLASDRIAIGGLELDIRARCAWLDGQCLDLTRSEFRLLCLFMMRPAQAMRHEAILAALSPDSGQRSANAVEVLVARLRRKIGAERIQTIRGIGYRFRPTISDVGTDKAKRNLLAVRARELQVQGCRRPLAGADR